MTPLDAATAANKAEAVRILTSRGAVIRCALIASVQ